MKDTNLYLLEVEEALKALPRQIPAGFAENYVGGGQSNLKYLGLKATLDCKLDLFSFLQD